MTVIKTKELSGVALDWAVAKCLKTRVVVPPCWADCKPPALATLAAARTFPYGPPMWAPSKDWAQAGPIIESEKIELEYFKDVCDWRAIHPKHYEGPPYASAHGETALVAAMRAYAASKFGKEIDVPKSLSKFVEAAK